MSESEVVGHMGRVIVTRLEPNEDLLLAIGNIVKRHGIKAGVVLSITGGLNKAVIQHFVEGQEQIGVIELPGPLEASGHGIVGWVEAPGTGKAPFGVGRYIDGEPYVHVHITLTSAHQTICGHLMEGTTIRSKHRVSHFTVMIAEVEGAALNMKVDAGEENEYKGRGVYHELVKLPALPSNG
jgi:predicted DNA-binding protein with PD1-like motif